MGKIYDRKNKTFYEDKQYGGNALKFLYGNIIGRIILKLFIAGKGYSRYNARKNSTEKSKEKIAPFVKEYGINLDDFEDCEFSSFADFFTRNIKEGRRPFSLDPDDLCAVADSKLLCYKITEDGKINIKNSIYTASEIIGEELSDDFYGGDCLVFRLTVDDYHHYSFFDKGRLIREKYIEGRLHTVSPISARRYKVFAENCRSVSLIEIENFGECYQVEIGALLVGKINNKDVKIFERGDEKGYFEMGGSTCVVMLKKDAAIIDEDIRENSDKGIETKVLMGERIGRKNA
jgi:phosphatidylserine decarboxylase